MYCVELLLKNLGVIECLWRRIVKIRPEYWKPRNGYLLHDNAPPYKTVAIREFFYQKRSHLTFTLFTKFVTVQLFPILKNENERNVVQWRWNHISHRDEGHLDNPKDGLVKIHPCVGSASWALYWCRRDIFQINILSFSKINNSFLCKKFSSFSDTVYVYLL